MATAELYLTGIGERRSHPWRGRVGWQAARGRGSPCNEMLPWVLGDSLDSTHTPPSRLGHPSPTTALVF